MLMKSTRAVLFGAIVFAPSCPLLAVCAALVSPVAMAQTAAPAAGATPRQSGTVKTVASGEFVLTNAAGQDVTVTVPSAVPVLLVAPGSHDLKSAQPGTVADIAAGDKAIVNVAPGASASAFTASRIIVMKSGAIAASQAADQAAWAQGVGGIVKSVDASTGTLTLSSGLRTITVNTTPQTTVRRYAGGSVRFEDAVVSSIGEVHAGDQIRVRGPHTPDSSTVTADAIVAGSFSNFSGLLTAVDATAGTVTLRDLASKRSVTVAVTASSNLRRMPAGAAGAVGARGAGGAGGGAAGGAGSSAGSRPAATETAAGGTPAAGQGRAGGGSGGGARAGVDLSRMITHMPTETLAGLKAGDAVMIVASNAAGSGGEPTAITLLAGVEQILAAHPTGETTLSPWNIGGGGEGEGEGGEGGGPR